MKDDALIEEVALLIQESGGNYPSDYAKRIVDLVRSSGWTGFDESTPPENEIIDVWQSWLDEDTGEMKGRRLANCWFYSGAVYHGAEPRMVRCCTHWLIPSPPIKEK